MPPHTDHSEINLTDYLRVMNERKWYIIAFVLVTVTIGIIFSIKSTPIFRSMADIEISPYIMSSSKMTEYRMAPRNIYEYTQFSKTKIADLKSITTASLVSDILAEKDIRNLDQRTRFKEYYIPELLQTMIKADPIPETYIWNISVEGPYSDDLPVILEVYISVFIERNSKELQQSSGEYLQNKTKEQEILLKKKREYSLKLQKMKIEAFRDFNIYLKPDSPEEAAIELSSIDKELADTKDTKKKLRAILDTFTSNIHSELAVPSSLEGLHWPAIDNQKKEYLIAYTRYKSLEEKYGKNHPKLIEAQQNVKSILTGMEETIKSEITLQENKEQILSQNKEQQFLKINKLEEIYPSFFELYDNYTTIQTKLEALEAEKIEMEPATWQSLNNIDIVNPSTPPFQVKPNIPINIILSFILGSLLGVGAAFLREYIDRSIKTIHHYENVFDNPVIGVLPYIKKEDTLREASVYYNDNSIYADVFRLLRTKLVYFNQENPDLKVFMVTSSNAGEGKTLITSSLAFSFQRTNKSVLLVEGDLWKPGIKKVFKAINNGSVDIKDKPGLSEVLEGKATLEESVFPLSEDKQNLHILFSGHSSHTPSEIISPDNCKKFIAEVKEKYDCILIDTPPVNEKSDGAVLASVCDGVLMVVKRGSTTWEAANNAKRILSDIQANIIGGILNVTTSGRYYGPYDMYKSYYYSSYYQDKT